MVTTVHLHKLFVSASKQKLTESISTPKVVIIIFMIMGFIVIGLKYLK